MIMTCNPKVTGLCTTCLEERCHDNGECIIGCVAGYIGRFCQNDCPCQCLNKACHFDRVSGAITCTDGCEPGHCDTQCSVPCPEGCVTCDRQCGSCNMTLCPERRYGANCEVCNPRYGKCDRETGQCIICRRGYYGDECTKTCRGCFNPEQIIMDKCLPGCKKCQAEGSCPTGFLGYSCENRCSEHCLSGICNKATGECSDGCVSGYHGLTCNSTCSEHCLSGICNKATGECSDGCVSGYHGLNCKKEDSSEGRSSSLTIIASVIVICFFLGLLACVGYLSKRKCVANADLEAAQQLLPMDIDRLKSRTKDEIRSHTAGMVRVSTVDDVLAKMDAGLRFITITGNAGDGKTTVGFLVLKELGKKFNVFTIKNCDEYNLVSKMDGDRVVMFDDIFGAFIADLQLIRRWFDIIRNILSLHSNIKVIFLCRVNVLIELEIYNICFVDTLGDTRGRINLCKTISTREKVEILKSHLDYQEVVVSDELIRTVSTISTVHGFPNCCKLYSELIASGRHVDIENYFQSPLNFLDTTTNVLFNNDCKDLFKSMIQNGGQFDVYTVEDEDMRQELLQVEKEQEGSYITVWRNGICFLANPAVYESVLNVMNDNDPLFCVQHVTLKSLCYIIVKPIPAVLQALAERFREDVLKGDFSVFKHRLCESVEFCQVLVSCCLSTNEFEQFINEPGENGETILWTALRGMRMFAVKALVEAQADVNIKDDRGTTPLHYLFQPENFPAAVGDDGFVDVVSTITKRNGDVNICDQYGQTPLHYLCKLKSSSSTLQMDTLDLLIKEGKGDFNKGDRYGSTPFHYLCGNRQLDFDVIQQIIDTAKGDINKQDTNGNTPLHYLCRMRGYADDLLSKHQGQIPEEYFRTKNSFGITPSDYYTDKDDSLPWTDGMAADMVLTLSKQEDRETLTRRQGQGDME